MVVLWILRRWLLVCIGRRGLIVTRLGRILRVSVVVVMGRRGIVSRRRTKVARVLVVLRRLILCWGVFRN